MWQSARSLKQLKERLRAKTPRTDGRSLRAIVADGNRTLRGGLGYFQHRKANVFAAVDERLAARARPATPEGGRAPPLRSSG